MAFFVTKINFHTSINIVITLFKNTANSITVTLAEKTTISNPNYLFEFINKETHVKYYCIIGEDLTTSLERYNKFIITEKIEPDVLQSEINLSVGQYSYEAFQLTDVQLAGLNLNSVDTSIYTSVEGPEQMRVKEPVEINTFYEGTPVTNTVYES